MEEMTKETRSDAWRVVLSVFHAQCLWEHIATGNRPDFCPDDDQDSLPDDEPEWVSGWCDVRDVPIRTNSRTGEVEVQSRECGISARVVTEWVPGWCDFLGGPCLRNMQTGEVRPDTAPEDEVVADAVLAPDSALGAGARSGAAPASVDATAAATRGSSNATLAIVAYDAASRRAPRGASAGTDAGAASSQSGVFVVDCSVDGSDDELPAWSTDSESECVPPPLADSDSDHKGSRAGASACDAPLAHVSTVCIYVRMHFDTCNRQGSNYAVFPGNVRGQASAGSFGRTGRLPCEQR